MTNFGETFQSAKTFDGNYETIAEGTYDCEIADCSLDTTKQPNRAQWTFVIRAAEDNTNLSFVERKLWTGYQINDMGIPFLKGDLINLGVDVTTITSEESLMEAMGSCIGKVVEVNVKHSPKKDKPGEVWTNAYINKLSTDQPNW